jgi:hypothetical protein
VDVDTDTLSGASPVALLSWDVWQAKFGCVPWLVSNAMVRVGSAVTIAP